MKVLTRHSLICRLRSGSWLKDSDRWLRRLTVLVLIHPQTCVYKLDFSRMLEGLKGNHSTNRQKVRTSWSMMSCRTFQEVSRQLLRSSWEVSLGMHGRIFKQQMPCLHCLFLVTCYYDWFLNKFNGGISKASLSVSEIYSTIWIYLFSGPWHTV